MRYIDKYIAFDKIFKRFYAVLCVYAESFVRNLQTAEDLVHDVFVHVWERRENLTLDDTMSAYLYKSVHNACVEYLRHQKVKDRYTIQIKAILTEAELIPFEWVAVKSDPAEVNEIKRLYRHALNQLPAQTREIYISHREKGMKYSEIAEMTGLSLKSVEYHISKALGVLRIALKDYLT